MTEHTPNPPNPWSAPEIALHDAMSRDKASLQDISDALYLHFAEKRTIVAIRNFRERRAIAVTRPPRNERTPVHEQAPPMPEAPASVNYGTTVAMIDRTLIGRWKLDRRIGWMLDGRPISFHALMREVNAVRKARGEPQIDRSKEWLVP